MKNNNWFWGSFFVLAAIFIIASQIGIFGQVGAMSIVATVLLVGFFIQSIMDKSFFGIFISFAFLYMIYWRPLHLVPISAWQLLTAAVFLSIGCSMLFKRTPPKAAGSYTCTTGAECSHESIDNNNPFAKVSCGASSKFLHGDCVKTGQFFVSLGELEVFFDQCKLSPDGAEVYIDCSLGTMKLFVPKTWVVLDNVRVTLGELSNKRYMSVADDNAPKLYLTGNIQLGSVEIHYI